MNLWRLGAAATVTALLAASAPGADAPAAPVPPGPAGTEVTGPAVPAPGPPPYQTCPVAALPTPPARPPRPAPPPGDPRWRVIGGPALVTAGLTIPPGAPPVPAATLTATSWLVADLDTGAVLGGCGPHEYGTPASVQKLLLAATLLPRLDPARVVQVTQADLDFERGSSAVGLLLGGRYTVETLWLGLLLESGNDAANVLARVGGGSAGVAGTIQAMNAEAHRLGAYQTHAVTPSGLDGPGQFTSAYDLALIARACFDRADFRRYTSTRRAQIPAQPPKDPRGFQIQNENQLLYRYPGALGGKTGFTSLARHTYVGVAERNGRRLVVTLLGAEARPARGWQQGAALLDWGFAVPRDAAVGRLVAPGAGASGAGASGDGTSTDGAPADAVPGPASSAGAVPARTPGGQTGNPDPAGRPDAGRPQPTTARQTGWSPGALAGMAAAVAAVPLILFVVTRRLRARQARARQPDRQAIW